MAIVATLTVGWSVALAAQGPPGSDIYLVSMDGSHCPMRLGDPLNITARDGYDNQPSFLPDGAGILYTSIREDGQADIYRYDIASGATRRVTATAESEYSPTVMPGGAAFSTVRVEADSTQRLWAFDLNGGTPRLLLPDVQPVGYHAWGDARRVALFVLGDPPTLQLADLTTGEARVVARNIGRSLHRVPGRPAISFLHRASDGTAWIKELDLGTGDIRDLRRPLGDNEFYAWRPDGELLMGYRSGLYGPSCDGVGEWEQHADLANFGISGITRLAVSPDGTQLAIVGADGGG